MYTMVFLILWVSDQEFPTARFVHSYETVKECNEYIENSALEKEIKRQLACLQVVAEPLKDAAPI